MLVLSRRLNQKIVFPNCGVTLEVLGVKGNTVRLGIVAPPEVQVLREELAGARAATPAAKPRLHALCNRLNRITLGLHRVEIDWAGGEEGAAHERLHEIMTDLESLDRDWIVENCSILPAPPAAATPAEPTLRRVLLVEDDLNERELLAGFLNAKGCECATAGDGIDALTYLEQQRPDLVLLDMNMPRCDGPETLRRIRRDPHLADLRIVSISGSSPEELGISIGPKGLDAWFAKPLNPSKLWTRIQADLQSAN